MHWAGLMPGAGGLLSPALVAAHLTSYHVNVDPTRGTRPPAGHRVHRTASSTLEAGRRRTFALYVAVCVLFYLTLTLTLDTSQSAREATRALNEPQREQVFFVGEVA